MFWVYTFVSANMTEAMKVIRFGIAMTWPINRPINLLCILIGIKYGHPRTSSVYPLILKVFFLAYILFYYLIFNCFSKRFVNVFFKAFDIEQTLNILKSRV